MIIPPCPCGPKHPECHVGARERAAIEATGLPVDTRLCASCRPGATANELRNTVGKLRAILGDIARNSSDDQAARMAMAAYQETA